MIKIATKGVAIIKVLLLINFFRKSIKYSLKFTAPETLKKRETFQHSPKKYLVFIISPIIYKMILIKNTVF